MRAWWGRLPWLGVLAVLLSSCRTTPPELRPKKVPEVCNDPPANDRRYDTNCMPKEAFKDMKDPAAKDPMNPMPGQGGMGAGGMGMGGMGPGMSPGGRPGGY
jgi:hypothetical protein